jgi:hypothetical protein
MLDFELTPMGAQSKIYEQSGSCMWKRDRHIQPHDKAEEQPEKKSHLEFLRVHPTR